MITMNPAIDNMPARDLRKIVLRLPEKLPITDAYEGRDNPGFRRTAWYRSQQEHIAGWLNEYDTVGAYNRQNPGRGAKFFYNHFKCVAGLIWLAEALGIPESTVKGGVAAVNAAKRNPASECGAFRKFVPWSLLAPRLLAYMD